MICPHCAIIKACGYAAETAHRSQKRIIGELMKIEEEPDEDVRVYPLKDRNDVWRVLIKGFEGSLYENKWFFMIIELTDQYPEHCPLIRFIKPPFHPNITDQGRVFIDSLIDMSIKELIGQIRYLLYKPNFNSPVDLKRQNLNHKDFVRIVKQWNNKNGKNTPEEWENEWKIQCGFKYFKAKCEFSVIPKHFLCPITGKIMKKPVKATSGVFYEKSALEKYLVAGIKCDRFGYPVPLSLKDNMGLPVDHQMKTIIYNWIKDNDYHKDDEEDNEKASIILFLRKKKIIEKPEYSPNFTENYQESIKNEEEVEEEGYDFSLIRHVSRPRRQLSPPSK